MNENNQLVENLSAIRDLLGEKMTDVVDNLMQSSMNANTGIRETINLLSKLASKISTIVQESKQEQLTSEQTLMYNDLSLFAEKLGNAQYILNELAKENDKLQKQAEIVTVKSMDFGSNIEDLQDQARAIWGSLRDLGYNLPMSDLEILMNKDKS